MASSLPSASGTALAAAPRIPSSSSQHHYHFYPSKVSFRLFSKPKLLFSLSTKGSRIHWNRSAVTRAQLNKVSVDGSSNAAAAPPKPEVPALEEKDATSANELFSVPASEASFSEFMTQVASLVKLVDSRDIVELQLKQLNCELIIRKKEALPRPPPPVFMMQSPSHPAPAPSQYPPVQPTPTVAPAGPLPRPPGPTTPPTAKSAKSSLPPLKCPMAGTFYRNPATTEPPFVKVGDKVNKGQVLCIIEAMKLMNEIEADHSGTILEILVDDGKPVSVDQPLFVIEP